MSREPVRSILFSRIDALVYTGWIGCEYKPRGATIDGLGWRSALVSAQ